MANVINLTFSAQQFEITSVLVKKAGMSGNPFPRDVAIVSYASGSSNVMFLDDFKRNYRVVDENYQANLAKDAEKQDVDKLLAKI